MELGTVPENPARTCEMAEILQFFGESDFAFAH